MDEKVLGLQPVGSWRKMWGLVLDLHVWHNRLQVLLVEALTNFVSLIA